LKNSNRKKLNFRKRFFCRPALHPAFFVGKTSKGKTQGLLFGWSLQGEERGVK